MTDITFPAMVNEEFLNEFIDVYHEEVVARLSLDPDFDIKVDGHAVNQIIFRVERDLRAGTFPMTAMMRRVCMRLGIRPISKIGINAFIRAMPLTEGD